MAYKLETLKILPNGLNLLQPGDAGESLDLTDWWPGAAGKLEQAPQAQLLSNPAVFAAQNSILQADGRLYYSDGSTLRQIGRGGGDAAINSDYDGNPLGLISMNGYAWIMNKAHQRKDDGTSSTDWTIAIPPQPTLTDLGSPGGLSDLLYTYRITWVIAGLGETNPSTLAQLTPAIPASAILITRPAIPSYVTGWNIYRQVPPYGGAALDAETAPYLLNAEPILPVVSTYQDTGLPSTLYAGANQGDTDLLRLGTILEEDHDPAPAASVIANQSYNGRIVVANSTANPNRIWFTPALQPAFFRGSANANGGDWVDVGTDKGDAILAMTVRPGMVVIYRQKSIWRHLGDFGATDAVLEPAVPDLGIVGRRAVVATSLGDFFISSDGVYKFNGDWAQKESLKIEPLLRGLTVENFPALGTAYRSRMAIGYRNGRLWVSYPNTSGNPTKTLILHLDSQRWFASTTGYSAFLDIGSDFLGAGPGIFTLESTYGSGATLLAFQSQYLDCGLPDHEKTFGDLVISHNTHSATFTLYIRLNKNPSGGTDASPTADAFSLGTFTSSALTKQTFVLNYPATYPTVALRFKPIRAYNLSVRITGSGATAPPAFMDTPMLLHYYLEARAGQTFDTGNTTHGLDGVGTIDQIEIDCDTSAGAVTLTVYSDIPAGVLAERTGGGLTIAQTSGRQMVRLVLATPIDGRLFRHHIEAITLFQIYGYRVRVLPIGVYADGAQSDLWVTGSLAPGV